MLSAAYAASLTSEHKFHHACVVILHNKPVAVDSNINFVHAEVRALNKVAAKNRASCTVFSLRFSRVGKLQMAKPCQACQEYMRLNGLKFAHFSNAEGKIQKMRL